MREVARRGGISHQAPYHHFANREAILAAIAEEGFRVLNQALESVTGRNATARLIAAGRAYVEFAPAHRAHFQLMFRPGLIDLQKYPSARVESEKGFAILQSLVNGTVTDKLIPAKHARGMVTLSWAVVQGLSELLLEGPLQVANSDSAVEVELEAALSVFEFLVSRTRRSSLS